MNESLRRALLRARLSEEDVASRLEVDPKTVRRWLEGRLPYLRHRWALARMLGLDEADIWPQTRATQSRPKEVQAIYPHCGDVPRDLWQALFSSARREIRILATSGLFLATDPLIFNALSDRAQAGVELRICLRDPEAAGLIGMNDQGADDTSTACIRDALAHYGTLRRSSVHIRLHRSTLHNSIYAADDDCLIVQNAYGIAPSRSPMVYLRHTEEDGLARMYREGFEQIWLLADEVRWND